jgi:hypothetical protein
MQTVPATPMSFVPDGAGNFATGVGLAGAAAMAPNGTMIMLNAATMSHAFSFNWVASQLERGDPALGVRQPPALRDGATAP